MTDLTIDTKNAEALKTSLTDLLNFGKDTRKSLTDLRTALDEKLAQEQAERKTLTGTLGDTKSKIDELSTKMADALGAVANTETQIKTVSEQIAKHHEVIEQLHAEAKKAKIDVETVKAQKELTEAARSFQHVLLSEKGSVDPLKEITVTADDVTAYLAYKAAMTKAFRLATSVGNEMVGQFLSDAEKKSISTFTHGNRYWLSTELSNRIIACYQKDTDLTGMVSQTGISRGTLEMMIDTYVTPNAMFKCELDCLPKPAPQEPVPGTLTLTAHEMFASECISHTMIEDAVFDVEGWLAMKIAGQFVRGLNNSILTGTGNMMPDGIMRPKNHLTMRSGNADNTPSGTFTWQDLQLMAIKLEPRFQGGAVWWMSTNALASTMTMTDGFGRPIFSAAVLNSEGLPMLMGHPVVQVVQLTGTLATPPAKGFVAGTKPIMLGDWKQHYMMVVRRGFTALRNPYKNSSCGVTWEFSQRVGGGVMCSNAAMALEIV